MSKLELEHVRHALETARKNGFAEVELAVGDASFSATLRPRKRVAPVSQPQETATPNDLHTIPAHIVGYLGFSKGVIKKGDKLTSGQVIATINALGLRYDVESGVAGEVEEILVKEGEPVQYGQPILKVRLTS